MLRVSGRYFALTVVGIASLAAARTTSVLAGAKPLVPLDPVDRTGKIHHLKKKPFCMSEDEKGATCEKPCAQRQVLEKNMHTKMRLADKYRGYNVTLPVSDDYAWMQTCRAKQCCGCSECDGLHPVPECPSGYRVVGLQDHTGHADAGKTGHRSKSSAVVGPGTSPRPDATTIAECKAECDSRGSGCSAFNWMYDVGVNTTEVRSARVSHRHHSPRPPSPCPFHPAPSLRPLLRRPPLLTAPARPSPPAPSRSHAASRSRGTSHN